VSLGEYSFGFNGYENDNEIKGLGNSIDFGARVHDPRLGRFLSVDPLRTEFPFWSPYAFAANSPIKFVDLLGMGPDPVGESKRLEDGGGTCDCPDKSVTSYNIPGPGTTEGPLKYNVEKTENGYQGYLGDKDKFTAGGENANVSTEMTTYNAEAEGSFDGLSNMNGRLDLSYLKFKGDANAKLGNSSLSLKNNTGIVSGELLGNLNYYNNGLTAEVGGLGALLKSRTVVKLEVPNILIIEQNFAVSAVSFGAIGGLNYSVSEQYYTGGFRAQGAFGFGLGAGTTISVNKEATDAAVKALKENPRKMLPHHSLPIFFAF